MSFKYLGLVFILLTSLNSWGDSNLLDLLKAKKNKYALNTNCQNFIQNATHSTLKSSTLQALTQKLSDTKFAHGNFYHYTDNSILKTILKADVSDRTKAQKDIILDKGYTSIMEYQMTYGDALSNVIGVGFYVAANPFSSATYGKYQVSLGFSEKTVFFDYLKNADTVTKLVAQKKVESPRLGGCQLELILSLLFDENGIDIVHYNRDQDWMVIFNEDVIESSSLSLINATDMSTIIRKMIQETNVGYQLLGHVKEFGATGNHSLPLSTFMQYLNKKPGSEHSLITISKGITNWQKGYKKNFIQFIMSQPASDIDELVTYFSKSGIIPETEILSASFSNASSGFLSYITKRIIQNPKISKDWGSEFAANSLRILKTSTDVDFDTIIRNSPQNFNVGDIFKSYRGVGLNAKHIVDIINHMLYQEPSYFKALGDEDKYIVINDYLKNAKGDTVPKFMSTLNQLQYPLIATFNYILKRPTAYGNGNEAIYIINHIKTSKDPGLITDSLIALFSGPFSSKSAEMAIFLKENQAIFADRADLFFKKALELGIGHFEAYLTAKNAGLFSKEEISLMLSKTFLTSSGWKQLPLVVSVFNISRVQIRDMMIGLVPTTDAATAAYSIMKEDVAFWSDFIRLDNPQGISKVWGYSNLVALHKSIVNSHPDNFLSKPLMWPKSNQALLEYLSSKPNMKFYMSGYSPSEQMYVINLARKSGRKDLNEFLSEVRFTPELASAALFDFITANPVQEELEYLINSPSFVNSLNQSQFEHLANQLLKFDSELKVDSFVRDTSVSFGKALYFLMSLRTVHGDHARTETFETHFKANSLDDSKKTALENKYLEVFDSMDLNVRNLIWPMVKDRLLKDGKTKVFLNKYETLTSVQKEGISRYHTRAGLISEAISIYKQYNLNFLTESLLLDKRDIASSIFEYLEKSYPLMEGQFLFVINNVESELQTKDLFVQHTQKFICKKVNKYKAFSEVISAAPDKDEKRRLKDIRGRVCD